MTEQDRPGGAGGRPRDASIDQRVLSVTRELLLEVGWADLSIRMVAARAGVGRSSLNRRWSSKAELVLNAILGETPDLSPFSGTDLSGWIYWVVRGSHELFNAPDVREAVPGLLLALRENDDMRKALWANFSGPAVALFTDDRQATTSAQRRRADGGAAMTTLAPSTRLSPPAMGVVKAATDEQLVRVVDDFRAAAAHAVEAGFDAI